MTDYGTDSIYMGIIKGAIYSKFVDAHVDDMTNAVPPFDITAGAYLLAEAAGEYPKGTVFVTIVDPGVGTPRKPIVMETKNGYCFVAPDNGLLTLVAERFGIKQIRELTNKDYWRAGTTSTVFHGRDIFGPVGASLASGKPVDGAGTALDDIVTIELVRSKIETARRGTVMRTDPYGTSSAPSPRAILRRWMSNSATISILLSGSPWTAHSGPTPKWRGSRLAVVQSSGFVECAINKGSLADAIQETFGAPVTIRKAK